MLATLERPIECLVDPPSTRTGRTPATSPPAPPRLTLVPPAATGAVPPLPRLALVRPGVPSRAASSVPPVRMTMRARRLLAGLALLACAAVGVVSVDVLASVVPSDTSYAAQEAPYRAEGATGAGGLVPSSGSTITVQAGDTLWSLAGRVDPSADPRDVIAAIMTLNGLDSPSLQAGQVLRLP